MRIQIVDPLRLPKRVRRPLTVVRPHVVEGPIAKVHAAIRQEIAIHGQLELHFRLTKVGQRVGGSLEFDLDVGKVGGVVPTQRPDGRAVKAPVVQLLARMVPAVEQPEVQTWLLGFGAVLR